MIYMEYSYNVLTLQKSIFLNNKNVPPLSIKEIPQKSPP